ncbi:MAG: hypothetical protein ACLVL2_11855 [Bacteroides cellulosilyticus]
MADGSSTASPNVTTNEKLIGDWTEAQKEYQWSSTIAKEEDKAYCYGKFGFIRLGDQGHGADLITPYITDIVETLHCLFHLMRLLILRGWDKR